MNREPWLSGPASLLLPASWLRRKGDGWKDRHKLLQPLNRGKAVAVCLERKV